MRKRLKRVTTLILALTLIITAVKVSSSVFADTNTISLTFDNENHDGIEHIVCTNYTVNYNGETYVSDDSDPDYSVGHGCDILAYEFYAGSNDAIQRGWIKDGCYNSVNPYFERTEISPAIFMDIYLKPEFCFKDLSNKISDNALPDDAFSDASVFSDVTVNIEGLEGSGLPYNRAIVTSFETYEDYFDEYDAEVIVVSVMFYKDDNLVVNFREQNETDTDNFEIIRYDIPGEKSINPPAYKKLYTGDVVTGYHDFTDLLCTPIDLDHFNLEYSTFIVAESDYLKGSFDSVNKKVIHNVSDKWEYEPGKKAADTLTYQWKKLDTTKAYSLLDNEKDGQVGYYDDEFSFSLFDEDKSPYSPEDVRKAIYDDEGDYYYSEIKLSYEEESSISKTQFENGDIVELVFDRPLVEYAPYDPGIYISNDNKRILREVTTEDSEFLFDADSDEYYEITQINYYPKDAIINLDGETTKDLPSDLENGLYTCAVTISGDCFETGEYYTCYSSPVQIGHLVKFCTDEPNAVEISGELYHSFYEYTDDSLTLPECEWMTSDLEKVFAGWATKKPDGTFKLIEENTLNNITSDVTLYAVFEEPRVLQYPTSSNGYILKTNTSPLWAICGDPDLYCAVVGKEPPYEKAAIVTFPYAENGTEDIVEISSDWKENQWFPWYGYASKGDVFKLTILDGLDSVNRIIFREDGNPTETYDSSNQSIQSEYIYTVKDDSVVWIRIEQKKTKEIKYKMDVVSTSQPVHAVLDLSWASENGSLDMSSFEDGIYTLDVGIEMKFKYLGTFELNHSSSGGGSSSRKKKTVKEEQKVETKLTELEMYIGKKEALVNNEKKILDTAPFIEDDRAFLPVRFITENLNSEVSWDYPSKKVTIVSKDKNSTIILYIGSDIALVNDKEVKLDTKAFLKDDRTFVPIRFVSENLGCNVDWNKQTKEIFIKELEKK